MKRYIGKYLMLLGGLLALAPMTGCKLDDPVIPTEELYLRNFIKQYGLIDPEQDFSSAKQVNVKLNLPEKADLVNVYAKVGDAFYRVGCFAELFGDVTLPVDVSKATEIMMLDVDGVRYYTEPNGTVIAQSKPTSYAASSVAASLKALWIEPDDWDTVTTTNGETNGSYEKLGDQPRKKIFITKEGKMSANDDANGVVSYVESETSSVKDGFFNVQTASYFVKNLQNK